MTTSSPKYHTDSGSTDVFFLKINKEVIKDLSQRWHNPSNIFSGISDRSFLQKQVLSDMLIVGGHGHDMIGHVGFWSQ